MRSRPLQRHDARCPGSDPPANPDIGRPGNVYEDTFLRFNPAINVARDGRLGDRLDGCRLDNILMHLSAREA